MYCQLYCKERDILFNNICDIVDVETFVKLWSNEEDLFLCFLLGGIPIDNEYLDFEIWKNVMLIVCKVTKKWNLPPYVN